MTKSNQSSLDIADHLSRGEYDWCPEAETRLREQHDLIRQQQAEIKALKKSCLDEIFKRTYANQSAKVMEGYWQEAQAEIEALKLQLHTTLTNRDLRTYDGKTETNNEPLAWALRKAQEK